MPKVQGMQGSVQGQGQYKGDGKLQWHYDLDRAGLSVRASGEGGG